jgi:hypothetical protein
MNMISQIKSRYDSHPDIFNLAFIFLLALLCYGLLIPFLGFYWDDLPYLYQLSAFGPGGFPEYVASDRPFSAWIFMLTTWLFRFEPIGYHLLAFILRFGASVLFYAILKLLWPENSNFRLLSTAFFTVYPGFLQQPIALIYNHHLSVLCLFLGSLYLMLKFASSEEKKPHVLVFSLLMAFHMFSIENFALLELVRPILLWIILEREFEDRKARLRQVLKIWLPYLLVFLLFIFWRVFIFKFPTYEPGFLQSLAEAPGAALYALALRVPRDFFTATAGAWVDSITFPTVSSFGTAATFLFWALIMGAFALSVLFFFFINSRKESTSKSFPTILLSGISLFLLGAALIWVLDLPLRIEFAWDRMTIGLIPGVAILIGLTGSLIQQKTKWMGVMLLSGLIALAIGSHFVNGMGYKRDWENLQSLFQQLAWRIPALEEGTALLSSEPGVTHYSDNSLTSPLNLTYSDETNSKNLEHFFFYSDVRLGLALPDLSKNIPISQGYRSFMFTGNTLKMIAIQFDPPACLKVMDRAYSNSITNLNLTDLQTEELRLTDLELILPAPQNKPPNFILENFDEESWCYFFQKADLARQLGDYEEIASLGDQAFDSGFRPREASEWLPFLEGYSWLGQWDRVELILIEISTLNPNYQNGVCYTMRRIRNANGFPNSEKITELLKVYNCQ